MHAHIALDEAAVEVVDDDGAVVLVLRGPCDETTAERLVRLADAVRDEDPIVLDLSGVTRGGDAVAARLRGALGSAVAVRE